MHEIVVPLDGSTLAERAVAIARTIADETGASIRLIEVATELETDAATRYLQSAAESLLPGAEPGIEVVEARVGDSVADCVLRRVGLDVDGPLLCMSTHGRSGVGSVLMGSTAEDVLRQTRQPLLLVGRDCELPWPDHRRGLLVPLDGSDRYVDLLPQVAAVAERSGLQPVLVKIAHSFDVEDAHHPMSGLEEAGRHLAGLGVEAKLAHQFASNVPVALTEAAREWGAALIMMGSYVKPGATRALMGSVTMRTVHDAPCPVLVYPRAPRAEGGDVR
jgi:nucleotide-binding universal stress UspA family protein